MRLLTNLMVITFAGLSLIDTRVSAEGVSRADVASAVAMILVRGKSARDERIDRTGTGFIIGKSRFVITAKHVVAPPAGDWGNTDLSLPDVTIVVRLRDPQTGIMSESRRASVRYLSPLKDAALLELEGLPRLGLATCPPVDESVPGTQLMIAGTSQPPGADTPTLTFAPGVLNEAQAQDGSTRRISAQTREGFSGAPVFVFEQQDTWHPVGLLNGGQMFGASLESKFTPLSELRGEVLAYCATPCRDPSHGVERYQQDILGPVITSDWLRGGSTSENFCGATRSKEMNLHPGTDITIENHGDVDHRFFTGWRDRDYIVREAQYKFSCQLRYRSGQIYNLRLSASCPMPPNPNNLPN